MATAQAFPFPDLFSQKQNQVTPKEALNYASGLIDRSKYDEAIRYIAKTRLPPVERAVDWQLAMQEEFLRLLIYQGHQRKAQTLLPRALARAKALQNPALTMKFTYWSGVLAIWENQPAADQMHQAYKLATELGDEPFLVGLALQGLGQVPELGSVREVYLEEALSMLQLAGFEKNPQQPFLEAQTLNSLAIYYGLLDDLVSAKSIFEETIDLAKRIGDVRRLAGTMINYASLCYLDQKDHEISLVGRGMLQEAVRLSDSIQALEYSMVGHYVLADYYERRGNHKPALTHFRSVYELKKKRGMLSGEQATTCEEVLGLGKSLMESKGSNETCT